MAILKPSDYYSGNIGDVANVFRTADALRQQRNTEEALKMATGKNTIREAMAHKYNMDDLQQKFQFWSGQHAQTGDGARSTEGLRKTLNSSQLEQLGDFSFSDVYNDGWEYTVNGKDKKQVQEMVNSGLLDEKQASYLTSSGKRKVFITRLGPDGKPATSYEKGSFKDLTALATGSKGGQKTDNIDTVVNKLQDEVSKSSATLTELGSRDRKSAEYKQQEVRVLAAKEALAYKLATNYNGIRGVRDPNKVPMGAGEFLTIFRTMQELYPTKSVGVRDVKKAISNFNSDIVFEPNDMISQLENEQALLDKSDMVEFNEDVLRNSIRSARSDSVIDQGEMGNLRRQVDADKQDNTLNKLIMDIGKKDGPLINDIGF